MHFGELCKPRDGSLGTLRRMSGVAPWPVDGALEQGLRQKLADPISCIVQGRRVR